MDGSSLQIWERLCEFQLDVPGIVQPFSHRLAQENDWRQDYANRVIEEYKKFLLLATISPQAVTPSKAIDQAWHLHLTYSRSYWEILCPRVLRKPLHHDPTTGSGEESEKFSLQYHHTLERYEETFGHPPPEDIWGKPKKSSRSIFLDRAARGLLDARTAIGRTGWSNLLIVLLLGGLPISVVLADTRDDTHQAAQSGLESLYSVFGWLMREEGMNSLLILGMAVIVGIVFFLLKLSVPPSPRKRSGTHGNCGGCSGGTSCGSGCGGGGCGGD